MAPLASPSQDEEDWTLDMHLSACHAHIEKAVNATEQLLRETRRDVSPFGPLLVLREALSNAMRHGCKNDAGKCIRYRLRLSQDTALLDIEDQGIGFDWRKHFACALPEADVDNGRGLHIMALYADEVSFNEKGNHLAIRLRLSEP